MEQEQKEDPEKEIKVTFEVLFDLLRNEKSRESIQKLDSSFYTDVKNYILEKSSLMESQSKTSDLFSSTERSKTEKQLTNARKIIKEIYERREKKVISMAINKSRISSNLIDTTALLKDEKEFFEQVVSLLSGWRGNILLSILEGKEPMPSNTPINIKPKEEKPTPENNEETSDPSKKSVRFSKAVPAFIGQDLKEYGPFEEDDTTELPIEIANLLIDKGNAEEV
jgi:DNA replication initiation complex subunit (GINS family)